VSPPAPAPLLKSDPLGESAGVPTRACPFAEIRSPWRKRGWGHPRYRPYMPRAPNTAAPTTASSMHPGSKHRADHPGAHAPPLPLTGSGRLLAKEWSLCCLQTSCQDDLTGRKVTTNSRDNLTSAKGGGEGIFCARRPVSLHFWLALNALFPKRVNLKAYIFAAKKIAV